MADVSAELHAVEMDRRHRSVRRALHLADRITQRGHAEHASAAAQS